MKCGYQPRRIFFFNLNAVESMPNYHLDSQDDGGWRNLQRRLYAQQKLWIDAALGPIDAELETYEARYDTALPTTSTPVPLDTLFESLSSRSVVLVGDFHTLRQSRRSFLRLLRRTESRSKLLIGLEYIEARHQKLIDDYLASRLELDALAESLHWDADPLMGGWDSYVPIFEWARSANAKIVGLDPSRQSPKHQSLHYRDQFAARMLKRAIKDTSPQQTFVLIGEMHLCPEHLPNALNEAGIDSSELLTIYQHCDPLYFDLQARNLEHGTEVSQLNESTFYLINTSPIVSQLSFLTWLEAEDVHANENSPEEKFIAAGQLIDSSFSLGAAESLEQADIFSVTALDRIEKVLRKHDNEALVRELHRHILNADSYVIPQEGLVYLASPSINHASEEATHWLRYACSGSQTPISKRDAFYHRALEEAIGFFGSKMVNPRRKCLRADTCEQIAKSRSREFSSELKTLARAAYAHERLLRGEKPRGFKISRFDFRLFDQLAHIIGYQLGERIYHGFREQILSKMDIRDLFFADLSPENEATRVYIKLYFSLLKIDLPERL